ncbi:MAG: fasciclin domain-containing protein [Cyanobacteria bacterium P01_A01_bin.84]
MDFFRHWSSKITSLLAFGVIFATANSIFICNPSTAQTKSPSSNQLISQSPTSASFSDVPANYWATPFIQALVEKNIIAGFPDGTFKPNQPVQRAEFAAMIEKAFNQNVIRQLPPGGFTDVPSDYWGASAIQRAYETGFMSGYPGNEFQPTQEITKIQSLVAITSGLRLTASNTQNLDTYYNDASAIPEYALSNITAATESNIVVNYPNVKILSPNGILTRAEATALLYQALVKQGQAQPLASNVLAANYIVGGVGETTTTAQTSNGNIVAIASSSNSFSTLTSLLQTAGLADILQEPGPYTVFAPTNAAFADLPPDVLQQLQQPENKEVLIKLLRYHVVPGELTASQLNSGNLETFEGQNLNIQVDSGNNKIAINNIGVIQPDIKATNGVIHAVNQVLIPPDLTGQQAENETDNTDSTDTASGVKPGRRTRGGSSYIGVSGNIGLGGETALGEGSFGVISKIGLTRRFSARPSVIINDDPVVLLPLTFDFGPKGTPSVAGKSFSVSPYIGAGVAIETSDDAEFGLLLTGGVDVPLGSRFTVNGSVNGAFLDDDTDVGIMLGIGYNF